jgi:hypothetical protein
LRKFRGENLEADQIAESIEEFNRNCEKKLSDNLKEVSQEKYLTGLMFRLTDILAIKYQMSYSFNVKLIFRFAILAVCFEGFEKIIEKSEIFEQFPLLKYSFVSIVLFIWLFNRRSKNKELYQCYRAICEALRTQSFWIKAGVHDEPADFFLVAAIGETTWVRRVVRTIWMLDYKYKKDWQINPLHDNRIMDQPNPYSNKISHQLDDIESEWIDGQASYFERKLKEADSFFEYIFAYIKGNIKSSIIQLELFEGLKTICLVLFVVLFVITNSLVAENIHLNDETIELLSAFKTSFLLISGVIDIYIRTKLFEQEVKKYQMSFTMFKHAKSSYLEIKRLESFSTKQNADGNILTQKEIIAKKQNVFRNLGISALDESSIWYISNSETELEKPVGG